MYTIHVLYCIIVHTVCMYIVQYAICWKYVLTTDLIRVLYYLMSPSHTQAVSTSRTPGHTKHFQTVFLSPSLRLCDCPGLVFPSLVDRQLQVHTHTRARAILSLCLSATSLCCGASTYLFCLCLCLVTYFDLSWCYSY